MSSIEEVINHYQTSINKSLNDTARIVHCIGKLYKLPISVRHLQETGIGRTVNSLRKYDGEVGIAAKALVTKWKAMVAAEESDDGATGSGQQQHGAGVDPGGRHNGDRPQRSDMSDEEEDDADGGGGGGGDDAGGGHDSTLADEDDHDDDEASNGADEDETYDESQLRTGEDQRDGGAQSGSDSDEDESDDQTNPPDNEHNHHHHQHQQQHHHHHQQHGSKVAENKPSSSSHWNEHHSSSRPSGSKEERQSSGGGSSSRTHHDNHSSTSKQSSSSGHKQHAGGSKAESDHHRHSSASSGGGGGRRGDGEGKSHKSSSSSSRGDSASRKSSSNGDGERHRERSSSKHHSSGSGGTNDAPSGAVSSHSSSSSNARKESSHKESRHQHRSREEKGSSSSSSSKRHAEEAVEAAGGEASSASKRSRKEHRHHGGAVESPSSSSHSKKSSKTSSSAASSSSSSKHRHEKSAGERPDKGSESKSKTKRKERTSAAAPPASLPENEANEDSEVEDVAEGLDASGGASFADALAMIGMPGGSASKKKAAAGGSGKEKERVTVTKSSPSSGGHHSSKSKASSSLSSSSMAAGSSSSSRRDGGGIPSATELLSQKVKLAPLPEPSEMVEALPMISPHYRPMPLNQTVMDCVFTGGGQGGRGQRRPLTEEEALGQSMQSKNLRTKVYSGMKTTSKGVIPSLYDLCIRLLQDHLDEIGATGGIPFYILKPVLERANPTQLLHLEHFNPQFVEDSDVLWEFHCKRTFRAKQRNEEDMETWREMFLRCSEERDAKLKSLTQNIKLSQEQAAAPIRKTQLAYVDSAVKPPRSVINKQARYGTARAPVVSPAARVAALKAGNVAQVGDARLRVAAGVRDNAQAQVFQPTKPRKAPMMAKVLSSMKGFKTSFRR